MGRSNTLAMLGIIVAMGCQGAPQEPGGCAKDADCKGNRVCLSGQCVEPTTTEKAAPVQTVVTATEAPKQVEPKPSPAAQLKSNPSAFLTVNNVQSAKKGLLNGSRQFSSVTIVNKSSVGAQNISGDVTWVDASGKVVGTIPFTLLGAVAPGASQTFSGGSLKSDPFKTSTDAPPRVRITHVDVL